MVLLSPPGGSAWVHSLFPGGLSLFPENAHLSFCGRAQRKTCGTQKDGHMYTHVSVSEAFKELPRERGKRESVRRTTGGSVVEVKMERREKKSMYV